MCRISIFHHLHRRRPVFLAVLTMVALCSPDRVSAQQPDSVREAAGATRGFETSSTAPFALFELRRPGADLHLTPATSLEHVLGGLPGLIVRGGDWSDDEHLTARGLGGHQARGTRGLQLIYDGVPLTLPDGQVLLDAIDPVFVHQAAFLPGPASLFWGHGTGGNLSLSTDPENAPLLHLRAMRGSLGRQQLAAASGGAVGPTMYHVHASDSRTDGFREHSDGRASRIGLNGAVALDMQSRLLIRVGLADVESRDPGGLTRMQVVTNPTRAADAHLAARARRHTRHAHGTLSLENVSAIGLVSITGYAMRRRLESAMPYGFLNLDRAATGMHLSLQRGAGLLRWGGGIDVGTQEDQRRQANNVDGIAGNRRQLEQDETVLSMAAFGYARLALTERSYLHAGVRRDHVAFSAEDALEDDGDQSGDRVFDAWSPLFGLRVDVSGLLVYLNFRTAFSTPTTMQMAGRPDLGGGFATDLESTRARGLEAGMRGRWSAARLYFEALVYRVQAKNLLLPIRTEEGGERPFYRNIGRSRHQGFEAELRWVPISALLLQAAYSSGHYRRRDDEFDGLRLPGVPAHRVYGAIDVTLHSVWLRAELQSTSGLYPDIENTQFTDAYATLDLNVGADALTIGGVSLRPFLAIHNVLDVRYVDLVELNASEGRFHYPAPGRTLFGGVNISL